MSLCQSRISSAENNASSIRRRATDINLLTIVLALDKPCNKGGLILREYLSRKGVTFGADF